MPNVAVIGTGYVGLTTGVCFAHLGHNVVCADIDVDKIKQLNMGSVPILEDGLSTLLADGLSNGRLAFTNDVGGSVENVDFVFLCVPTPQSPTGEADLSYVEAAAGTIAPRLQRGAIVVNKSTVPVGSTRVVERAMRRSDVQVVSNPEFLREGTAIHDFLNPDRVVVGSDVQEAAIRVADLYVRTGAPVVVTDAASAEMIKYAANAFLATKLSFVNAVAAICEGVGADVRDVVRGMGYDKRIGHDFLRPGPGWGGSCFPKDTAALLHIASKADYRFEMLEGVISANLQQFDRTAGRISQGLKPGDRLAVWGLTFKALTDDLRDSPALEIVRRLVSSGFEVVAFDPTVKPGTNVLSGVKTVATELEACDHAATLAVLTEWEDFRWVDPIEVGKRVINKRVVDARNLLDRSVWRNAGFAYFGVGR